MSRATNQSSSELELIEKYVPIDPDQTGRINTFSVAHMVNTTTPAKIKIEGVWINSSQVVDIVEGLCFFQLD